MAWNKTRHLNGKVVMSQLFIFVIYLFILLSFCNVEISTSIFGHCCKAAQYQMILHTSLQNIYQHFDPHKTPHTSP